MITTSSVYNKEIVRAATLGLTSLTVGIIITNKKKIEKYWNAKWSSTPAPIEPVSTAPVSPITPVVGVRVTPPTIAIINATGNASVDKMNICKIVPNSQYIERYDLNIAEIKSRSSDVNFENLLREQILNRYPTKPVIPIAAYLNRSMIIIIF